MQFEIAKRYASADDCPKKQLHTNCPKGYLAWHEWADKKSKRHVQVQCPHCGYYAIWKRKPKGCNEPLNHTPL